MRNVFLQTYPPTSSHRKPSVPSSPQGSTAVGRREYGSCVSDSLVAATKCLVKGTQGKTGLLGLTVRGTVHDGREVTASATGGSWSCGTHSQKAERDGCWGSPTFSFLTNPE